MYITNKSNHLLYHMVEEVKAGKNLFIVTSSFATSTKLYHYINKIHQEVGRDPNRVLVVNSVTSSLEYVKALLYDANQHVCQYGFYPPQLQSHHL